MTLPIERTRSLKWTREFLTELKSDEDLPDRLRRHAEMLLRHYPDDGILHFTSRFMPDWWGDPSEVKD